MSPNSIAISELKMGKVMITYARYFTGGLIAIPVEADSYVVGPVGRTSDGFRYLGPYPFEEICRLAHQAGCYYVGCNETTTNVTQERTAIWYPHIGNTGASEHSADSWAGVAFQAREAGDPNSSGIARNVSISMASASRRLRDVALLHSEQLGWAVTSQRSSGNRYSNVAIHDLYLAIHSLLAEMCSARDYLCQLAAKRVGAKESTDNLARLQAWLAKPANSAAREDPLVSLIQVAAGSETDPGWLTKLSDLRDQITHRQPMGANPDAAALLFQQIATSKGLIPRLRLARFKRGHDVSDGEDPFVALLRYWLELEGLSQASVSWAPYEPQHPLLVVGD